MRFWNTIVLFLICFTFIRCEEEFDANLDTNDLDLLVVEGTLTNENINHRIKISKTYTDLGGVGDPVSGAIVEIFEGESTRFSVVEIPVGSGLYYTEPMRAVVGEIYTLRINYLGQVFFAQNGSTPVEPMEPLQYTRVIDSLSLFKIDLNESGRDPNYITHAISWTGTAACQPNEICGGILVYYDLKTADANELFKPDKRDFFVPVGAQVIRKKYSVNSSHRSFLRGVLSETEWRGGVFDIQRDNAPTNLTGGAIGYFAVSTVVSDTTNIIE